jgi:RNA-binding protein 39
MLGNEGNANAAIPYHRLYVGNLYYNLTADDIRQVFEPFGELAFVEMPMEPHVSSLFRASAVTSSYPPPIDQ